MSEQEIFIITPEEKKAIQDTFNKSDEEILSYINHIKEWFTKQEHLPFEEDEQRLKTLLIFNKYSLEKVKKKLDTYYSIKHLIPEYYINNNPLNPDIQYQLKSFEQYPLPRLNHDLCRVYIGRLLPNATYEHMLFCKIFFAQIDVRMSYDPCLADHYIYDSKYFTFEHIVKISPCILKQCFTMLHTAYSDRIKGIHFLNVHPVAVSFINLLNKLASEKISTRLMVHESLDDLHKYISKDILPPEYGGTYKNSAEEINNAWLKFFASKDSWLKELSAKRSDESKRIGEGYDKDMFGMYGSFRKINID